MAVKQFFGQGQGTLRPLLQHIDVTNLLAIVHTKNLARTIEISEAIRIGVNLRNTYWSLVAMRYKSFDMGVVFASQ